jgi:preprotein translocase subunit YajC
MFIAFYLILIRPQQRRMKEQQVMIDALKKGDKVITAGGLMGKITKLTNDREVEVELAKDIKVKVLRYTLQVDNDAAKPEESVKSK